MFVTRSVLGLLLVLAAPGLASAQSTSMVVTTTNAPVHGQSATVRATVTNTGPSTADPTGAVQFSVDGGPLSAPVALVNRTADFPTQPLRVGTHSVRAVYLPSGGFSTTPDQSVDITVGRADTNTVVRVVPDNAVAGEVLDVEVLVTPRTTPLDAPTGSVTVDVDGVRAGTDTLGANGIARGTIELDAAPHTLDVGYLGDTNYGVSGGSARVTIAPAGTMIVLMASPNPAKVGQSVTFGVSVDSIAPSLWWPRGVLTTAIDGTPVAGSVTVTGNGEGGGFTRTFSTPGTHTATAHFTGDQDFLATDASLPVTVTGAGYGDPFPSTVARRPLAARGLTLKATPRRDRRAPYTFVVTGTLQLPRTVAKANGCSGTVTVEAKLKAKRVARKTAKVTSACTFKTTLKSARTGSLTVTAAFGGNASVSGVDARAVKVKAG